ncbi:MAG: DegT/DnrJ/EryC1/StrS family aminotransferase [Promethearchaeota archaeon]
MPKFPSWPQWGDEEVEAVAGVVKSGQWWCGAPRDHAGENVWKLQEEFAEFQGARHAVAVCNGTVAIESALAATGVGPGDEVVVPDWTFVASASAVLALHALPVFCDVDPDTFVMDVAKVGDLLTPRTKAVVAVHLAGNPVDMDHLLEVAEENDLRVIEDCAHAHGSRYKGKRVGNWGDAGTFSFQASKVLTCGEGGAVVCNDEELADGVYSYSDCGRHRGEWFYDHFQYGTNYRMSEFNAAVLRAQLRKFPGQHSTRNENATYLRKRLDGLDGIACMRPTPGTTELGYYVFPFKFEPGRFGNLSSREFREALAARGIPTDDLYPPLHRLACFREGWGRGGVDTTRANWGGEKSSDANFPVVSDLYGRAAQLPHEVLLADSAALDYVVEVIGNIDGRE